MIRKVCSLTAAAAAILLVGGVPTQVRAQFEDFLRYVPFDSISEGLGEAQDQTNFGLALAARAGVLAAGSQFVKEGAETGGGLISPWSSETTVRVPRPPGGTPGDYFKAVALDGRNLIVGEPTTPLLIDPVPGRVHVYAAGKGRTAPVHSATVLDPVEPPGSASEFGSILLAGSRQGIAIHTPFINAGGSRFGRTDLLRVTRKGNEFTATILPPLAPGPSSAFAPGPEPPFTMDLPFAARGRSLFVAGTFFGTLDTSPPAQGALAVSLEYEFGRGFQNPIQPSAANFATPSEIGFFASGTVASGALAGRDIVLGCPDVLGPGGQQSVGCVFIVTRDRKTTSLVTLLPPDPDILEDGLGFGSAVAVDGKVLLVGAPGFNGGVGRIYLFQKVRGIWTLGGRVDYPSALGPLPGEQPRFGARLAAGSRKRVAASAPGATVFGKEQAGRVVLMRFSRK